MSATAISIAKRIRGKGISAIVLAGLGVAVPGLVIPTFAKVFVDDLLINHRDLWVGPLLFGMALAAGLRAAFGWVERMSLARLETRLAVAGSSRYLWHVLRLSSGSLSGRHPGELAGQVTDNGRIAELLCGPLASTVLDCLLVVFYALLMLQYDVVLTVAVLLLGAVELALLRALPRTTGDAARRHLDARGRLHGVSVAGLQLIETLKANASEDRFLTRWTGEQARATNAEQRLVARTAYLFALARLFVAVASIAVIGVGALRVVDGQLGSIGALVAFQSLMTSFLGPIENLARLASSIAALGVKMERVDAVLGEDLDPVLGAREVEPTATARLAGGVVLKAVSFAYDAGRPLIEGLDLNVSPGSRVALVGRSGSGKSTIAKLIAGLYAPLKGEILFDGLPRDRIPRAVINQSLALVDQDLFLFEGTVTENLTVWDPTLPEAAIVQAARDACIHGDVIGAFAGGYRGRIDESGRNLSGGQRQRIEIARALALDPSIVILDEATSALDPSIEAEIDKNLRRRGCTCIIVAHRLSTIRDADEILVIERGRVVERGTHDLLLEARGLYATLIEAGR
jgi:ABC-type bacteriocin/lantibiotic exporter with double-glycine peptidase domain